MTQLPEPTDHHHTMMLPFGMGGYLMTAAAFAVYLAMAEPNAILADGLKLQRRK